MRALAPDAHSVDFPRRSLCHRAHSAQPLGRFFNFNGTGGIWRKAAIVEAGGWQHDTLTEDLDLSYRAWLARFLFLSDQVPGEIPVEINGFKSQQQRWTKTVHGQKLLFALAQRCSRKTKVEATFP